MPNEICNKCCNLCFGEGIFWCSFDDPYGERGISITMVEDNRKECQGFEPSYTGEKNENKSL